MKKRLFVLILSVIILTCCLLVACEKKQQDKGYVTITFVTDCDVVIEPIVIDGSEDKYMPDDPMRAGYEFFGWYYDQSGLLPFSTSDAITMDITLYAKWKKRTVDGSDPEFPIEATNGLKYVYVKDYYTVVGYTGEEENLVVPARYAGYPVMGIANKAFAGTTIKKLSIGGNIRYIEDEAFRGIENLRYIEVAEGSVFFRDERGLLYSADGTILICVPSKTEVETLVLSTVVSVFPYAFENCTCSVEFSGDKYPNIEGKAFAGFAGKITLGKNTKSITKDAFSGATGKIEFSQDFEMDTFINGAFAGYAGETLVVPPSVTTIKWQPFSECTATVDLSKTGLTEICEQAFAGYLGKTLVIPYTVTKIGKNAFYRAKTKVTFEQGSLCTEVGELAFASFGDGGAQESGKFSAEVRFPSEIKAVGKNAFFGASAYVYFDSTKDSLNFHPDAFAKFDEKNCVYYKQ